MDHVQFWIQRGKELRKEGILNADNMTSDYLACYCCSEVDHEQWDAFYANETEIMEAVFPELKG